MLMEYNYYEDYYSENEKHKVYLPPIKSNIRCDIPLGNVLRKKIDCDTSFLDKFPPKQK